MSRAPPLIAQPPPVRVVQSTSTTSTSSSQTTTALVLLAAAAVAGAGVLAYRAYSANPSRPSPSSLPSRLSRLSMSSKASSASLSGPSYSKKPVVVLITGAAGQIGYSIIFMVAAGRMLGEDQPIELRLLDMSASSPHVRTQGSESTPVQAVLTLVSVCMCVCVCVLCSPPMMPVVQGVMMEIDDCAFPLLTSQQQQRQEPKEPP